MSISDLFVKPFGKLNPMETSTWDTLAGIGTGTPGTLAGYDASGDLVDVVIGAGLTLSGNEISAVGSGSGNVVGSSGSVAQTPAIYTDTTGLVIGHPSVTPTTNTLIGYNGSTMSNITAGTNISISGGTISAVGAGTGDVSYAGGTAVKGSPAMYSDATGLIIAQPTAQPVANSLLGYNNTADIVNITAGTNITITGTTISASGGSGGGNVSGPVSSIDGGLVLFQGTSGELIQNATFTPANNSLLGYGTTSAVSNVTIGGGLTLSGGILSNTATGSGDVSGTPTSIINTPAIYTDTTGFMIGSSPILPTPNTIMGYDQNGAMSNITAGSGITIQNSVISNTLGGDSVLLSSSNINVTPSQNNYFFGISSFSNVTVTLFDVGTGPYTVPQGWSIRVCNESGSASVTVLSAVAPNYQTMSVSPQASTNLLNTGGLVSSFTIPFRGVVTIISTGRNSQAYSTRWNVY